MNNIIRISDRITIPFARFAIFLVYFWFGILKVFSASPASSLVTSLLGKTMPFMAPDMFLVLFGLFEVLIGIMILFSKLDKLTIILIALHLFTTILPLFLLIDQAWQGMFTPTMEGQYIIKNILIAALAVSIMGKSRS